MKSAFSLLLLAALLALGACADPVKYTSRKVAPCASPKTALLGAPYARLSESSCAVAIAPFDLAVWNEAPYNSHKVRGMDNIDLGCKPLSPSTDNCTYCGLPGHSNTLMINFDPSVYSEDLNMGRAMLAVYSPNNPQGLVNAQLRGRLNIGDEMQSLARNREGVAGTQRQQIVDGWIFFDVTNFVARAINERRNSIQFELSVPCQTPANNLVTVGVNKREPRLVVEFN